MERLNKFFTLNQRPHGAVNDNTWSYQEQEIPVLNRGQILIKNQYISLDPAMRGWMDDKRSYIPAVKIGEVMRASTIGRVVESCNDKFELGDYVLGLHGVQSYDISSGELDHNLGQSLIVPAEKFLSVLGMTGYTAYFGLLEIGKPVAGETIVVSAAAGAVGSIVGQIAKTMGLNVIGIAGGQEKCNYVVEELGFDTCIDYTSDSFAQRMIEVTSSGVDIYFDNVGGEMLDLLLTRINKFARVIICGAISQYNTTASTYGPKNYLSLLVNRAIMQGFIVFDYKDRYQEASLKLSKWLSEGSIKSKEDIVEGIENFPKAFNRLFNGKKLGKLVLKVD